MQVLALMLIIISMPLGLIGLYFIKQSITQSHMFIFNKLHKTEHLVYKTLGTSIIMNIFAVIIIITNFIAF